MRNLVYPCELLHCKNAANLSTPLELFLHSGLGLEVTQKRLVLEEDP